jgi:hypothetical protein
MLVYVYLSAYKLSHQLHMSYCIRSYQPMLLFIRPRARPIITLIIFYFFSKSGIFRICFKTESVIKADCFYLAVGVSLLV